MDPWHLILLDQGMVLQMKAGLMSFYEPLFLVPDWQDSVQRQLGMQLFSVGFCFLFFLGSLHIRESS